MSQAGQKIAEPLAGANTALLRADGVSRSFQMGDSRIEVLRHVDLAVRAGEFVAIEGRSGSGKSTLLHILGALDVCDRGAVSFEGRELAAMTAAQRSRMRNTQIGFVFQFYYLLPELNVLENTLLAAMVQHSFFAFQSHKRRLRQRAADILKELSLDHRLKHRPAQLSGGERQRVAIARALMNQPRVILADEPTGNLDVETGQQIMALLERLHHEHNQTIVMVTHDRTLARKADRVLVLREGQLEKAEMESNH